MIQTSAGKCTGDWRAIGAGPFSHGFIKQFRYAKCEPPALENWGFGGEATKSKTKGVAPHPMLAPTKSSSKSTKQKQPKLKSENAHNENKTETNQ